MKSFSQYVVWSKSPSSSIKHYLVLQTHINAYTCIIIKQHLSPHWPKYWKIFVFISLLKQNNFLQCVSDHILYRKNNIIFFNVLRCVVAPITFSKVEENHMRVHGDRNLTVTFKISFYRCTQVSVWWIADPHVLYLRASSGFSCCKDLPKLNPAKLRAKIGATPARGAAIPL